VTTTRTFYHRGTRKILSGTRETTLRNAAVRFEKGLPGTRTQHRVLRSKNPLSYRYAEKRHEILRGRNNGGGGSAEGKGYSAHHLREKTRNQALMKRREAFRSLKKKKRDGGSRRSARRQGGVRPSSGQESISLLASDFLEQCSLSLKDQCRSDRAAPEQLAQFGVRQEQSSHRSTAERR